MATAPVIFNNNVLRDGHQSLAATRMTTHQMLPALEALDGLGFGCLETWGGATIDAGLRFLHEFPFDRLDAIRAKTKTKHMMLLRGQNIVQYAHFPDDVVETFIKTSAKHGMDIFRIFDALNDPRNMETAIKAAKEAGKEAQGVMCYTTSPVHTTEAFVKLGQELEDMGCGSLCLKDMAGLVPPYQAYQIIKGLKDSVKIPVVIHTHETAGLGASTYYAAIEAGVDAVDTSIIPFANGTGQPDTGRMLALLEGHPRCPKYDLDALQFLREHFTKIYAELSDYTSFANERVDSDALKYQVPGGMLSNFRNQLKEQNMEDKFEDVFKEIPVVREALGWIPLVTPTSQIVGVQAMLNVKFGRWKNFTPQAIDIALGYYGRTPAPVNPEVQKIAAEKSGKDPITCRPADLKDPGMAKLRQELKAKEMPDNDEHCVIHAMFPAELEKIYKNNLKPMLIPETKKKPAAAPAAAAPAAASEAKPAGPKPDGASRYTIKVFTADVEEVS
ncbi:pyruvate carboxylase subunit B [Pelagicoccus sp. SDUM812003]|uniref:pyruvate carboxylase subunit B n=1 Tax=Pelagicoccus sp. SDUM812003 TaxID=3041267 RepID=UPI00280DE8D1|nr:pyruvate carboxylase subunit B [Pelagicoccus sp. SDUM812003]MDQ8202762.1 pyruvate carboxylase subunit B [Pelagicoccus sp. SDUM812003]